MRSDHTRLVILDIDGTLLDTPHLVAWRTATATLLAEHGFDTGPPLSEEDYQRLIAGRPRAVGAAAAIAAAGAEPAPELVAELTRHKQELFGRLASGTTLFDDAARFLERAAEVRAPIAFCTASRNAGPLLRERLATLSGGTWLAGRLRQSLGPAAAMGQIDRVTALRRVAAAWAVPVARCTVIDDARHGIAAARELDMPAVLVDRTRYAGTGERGPHEIRTLDELDPAEPLPADRNPSSWEPMS